MKTIWIIEDDPGLRFVYEEALGRHYKIVTFADLQSFGQSMEDSFIPRPDLLIADLRLPDECFLNYLDRVDIKGFPFMIVSSNDDVDSMRSSFKKGAIDYIVKPFKSSELLVKIENATESIRA